MSPAAAYARAHAPHQQQQQWTAPVTGALLTAAQETAAHGTGALLTAAPGRTGAQVVLVVTRTGAPPPLAGLATTTLASRIRRARVVVVGATGTGGMTTERVTCVCMYVCVCFVQQAVWRGFAPDSTVMTSTSAVSSYVCV